MTEKPWFVRLSPAAEVDFFNTLRWTATTFGTHQSQIYRATLIEAIGDLTNGPDVAGSKARDDIAPGVRALHVARHGRRGRHILLYRIIPNRSGGDRIIEIGRILHDRMDLGRHFRTEDSP